MVDRDPNPLLFLVKEQRQPAALELARRPLDLEYVLAPDRRHEIVELRFVGADDHRRQVIGWIRVEEAEGDVAGKGARLQDPVRQVNQGRVACDAEDPVVG